MKIFNNEEFTTGFESTCDTVDDINNNHKRNLANKS